MKPLRVLWVVSASILCVACARGPEPGKDAVDESSLPAPSIESGREHAPLGDAEPMGSRESSARSANVRGPGSSSEHVRDMLALADTVAVQGDAQALTLAALLRDSALTSADFANGASSTATTDDNVRRWLDEAERKAPDDAAILALAVHAERRDMARRQALIARWRALEPDNMVPVLYSSLPEQAMFEAAADTTVFDSHYDGILRLIMDVLSRTSSPVLARMRAAGAGALQEEHDVVFAISYWSMIGIPAFQAVTRPCRSEVPNELRRQECRWIAMVLLHRSDNIMAETVGANMLQRGLGSAAERAQAEAYTRESQWLIVCTADAYARNRRVYAQRFHRLIRGTPHFTERTLMRLLAVETGYPPMPPRGWKQSDGL